MVAEVCYAESQLISIFLWGVISIVIGIIIGWYITYKSMKPSPLTEKLQEKTK